MVKRSQSSLTDGSIGGKQNQGQECSTWTTRRERRWEEWSKHTSSTCLNQHILSMNELHFIPIMAPKLYPLNYGTLAIIISIYGTLALSWLWCAIPQQHKLHQVTPMSLLGYEWWAIYVQIALTGSPLATDAAGCKDRLLNTLTWIFATSCISCQGGSRERNLPIYGPSLITQKGHWSDLMQLVLLRYGGGSPSKQLNTLKCEGYNC